MTTIYFIKTLYCRAPNDDKAWLRGIHGLEVRWLFCV